MEQIDTGSLTTRASRKLSNASSGALSESRIPRPPLTPVAKPVKSEPDSVKVGPQRRSSIGSLNARSSRDAEEHSVHSGSDSDRVQVTIRLRPLRCTTLPCIMPLLYELLQTYPLLLRGPHCECFLVSGAQMCKACILPRDRLNLAWALTVFMSCLWCIVSARVTSTVKAASL